MLLSDVDMTEPLVEIFMYFAQSPYWMVEGFKTKEEIQSWFPAGKIPKVPKRPDYDLWYKADKKKDDDKTYPCFSSNKIGSFELEKLTDEWLTYFLTTPASINAFTNPGNSYEEKNVFLFNERNTFVYFLYVSPFQRPYFKRITMTKKAPLLVPVYIFHASVQDFPSKKGKNVAETGENMVNLIKNDLAGVIGETVEAKLDGEYLVGCAVVRDEPLEITNVPTNNIYNIPENRLQQETGSTMNVYHGGLWLLIREEAFTEGDHLLDFKAASINYEIEAKILISAIYDKT